jgi:uncharacterized damage-inducible protein DinB
METVENLRKLFAYNAWANREELNSILACGSQGDAALELLAHIVAAERLWYDRAAQLPQSTPVWPKASIEEIEKAMEESARLWKEHLAQATQADLDNSVEYHNSKGEKYNSRFEDIAQHVLLHAAHHRGQIALRLRTAGAKPAYVDFIHAVRQGFIR